MKVIIYTFFSVILVLSLIVTAYIVSSKNIIEKESAAVNTLEGHVDSANCTSVKGWGWNATAPDSAIKIVLYANGTISQGDYISNTIANINRPDIAALVTEDNGKHGFEITIPDSLKKNKNILLYVYAFDFYDGTKYALLKGSPLTINCPKS